MPSGIVYVGTNPYQLLAASANDTSKKQILGVGDVEVRVVDSTFRNITYSAGSLFHTWDQDLHVERCQFSNIELSDLLTFCPSDLGIPMLESSINNFGFDRWCQNLILCTGQASCSVKDICVENFEYAGRGGILTASYTADVRLTGTNYVNRMKPDPRALDEALICPSGFSWTGDGANASSCMNVNTQWTTGLFCSIGNTETTDVLPPPSKANEAADAEENNSPVQPYDCFNSTLDLIEAQYAFPSQLLFIMCPFTTISIGRLANVARNDTRIVYGDLPLMVARSNVEVRCGLQGDVRDECVLDGGMVQVGLDSTLPSKDRFRLYMSERTDNVTIIGMTFTGELYVDPLIGGK